ncbi:MAG: hypothetical protein ABIR57_09305, partial [Aeromicrobium sp.]
MYSFDFATTFTFSDRATITHTAGGPAPTGTVTFLLYGPGDRFCNHVPYYSSIQTLSGAGTEANAQEVKPALNDADTSHLGVYRWVASYSGDANYAPSETSCNDEFQNVDVESQGDNVGHADNLNFERVQSANSITLGESVTDTVTLTPPNGLPLAHPSSDVSFQVFPIESIDPYSNYCFNTSNPYPEGYFE